MHLKLFVLISVTLTIVQLAHTYRVSTNKNGQPILLSEYINSNLDDEDASRLPSPLRYDHKPINSLSDFLSSNSHELQDDADADDDDDDDEMLNLIKSLKNEPVNSRLSNQADYEYLTDPTASQVSQPPVAAIDEEELESHSSLVGGQVHQYVSGGAGEGKQHLQPDGAIDNKEEVKSDEDLPAYCDPPNPCPIGVMADDCDPRPYEIFSAQFSKEYQEQQNCMCDDDHNECHKRSKNGDRVSDLINNLNDKLTQVVAKKSPRVRRETKSDQNKTNKKRLRNLQAVRFA